MIFRCITDLEGGAQVNFLNAERLFYKSAWLVLDEAQAVFGSKMCG